VLFNGAATSCVGGSGFTLHINQSHHSQAKLGLGHNTNMRAEILALWSLMYFVVVLGLPSLMVWDTHKWSLTGQDGGRPECD